MDDRAGDPAVRKAHANELIEYIGPISKRLTLERTALESSIIPVSAYIVTACIEAFLRYPDMMREIDQALPAEEIGRRARRPGCRVNTVYLWSISNFFLIGRKVYELVEPERAHDLDSVATVLEFWERATTSFRADGTRMAEDNATAAVYSDDVLRQLEANLLEVDDDLRGRVRSFNATLVAWLFLLYFDTRVGHGDTGPYPAPPGPDGAARVMLVRDYYDIGESDFWWSDVARDVPYRNLTASFVLEGVDVERITDFGTTYTSPEDFLDHLVGFALMTTDPADHGSDHGAPASDVLRPIPLDEMELIVTAVRRAQSAHYRNIMAMDRDEKIRCGAYVYFSFLRPFALEAGVADRLDWTVPRDIPDLLYQMVSVMEGDDGGLDDDGPYYAPLP